MVVDAVSVVLDIVLLVLEAVSAGLVSTRLARLALYVATTQVRLSKHSSVSSRVRGVGRLLLMEGSHSVCLR